MSYPQTKPLSYWQHNSPKEVKTMGDMVTPRQLVAIRSIGNSQRIDFDVACKILFGCLPEELNRQSASTLIDWLKVQVRRNHPADPMNFCPECQNLQLTDGKQAWCIEKHIYEVASIASS